MDLEEIFHIVFAGFVIPLQLLPAPWQMLAQFTPWAAPVYYPVMILTEPISTATIWLYFGCQLFWILTLGVLAQVTFRRGLRAYTGVSQ